MIELVLRPFSNPSAGLAVPIRQLTGEKRARTCDPDLSEARKSWGGAHLSGGEGVIELVRCRARRRLEPLLFMVQGFGFLRRRANMEHPR